MIGELNVGFGIDILKTPLFTTFLSRTHNPGSPLYAEQMQGGNK